MFKNNLDIHAVTEIRCKSNIYFGCGAINRINDIADQLISRNIKSVLVISGRRAYKSTGAWGVIEPALTSRGIRFDIYDKVTPNPTTAQIDEATAMGKAVAAGGYARYDLIVISGPNRKIRSTGPFDSSNLCYVTAGFLDAYNIRNSRKSLADRHRNIHTGPGGNVIKNNG